MAQIKAKVTRMYFDGERRVKEGEIVFVDEKTLIPACHQRLDGKAIKGAPEKKKTEVKKGPLPGQGPAPKPPVIVEKKEEGQDESSEDPSGEETPI